MILVAGATGMLGGEICRLLGERGRAMRALVRESSDQGRVEHLRELGAQIAVGDLRDRASLDEACKGVSVVVSTANTTHMRLPDDSIADTDHRGQLQLVDAAQDAGVRQFVYVSFSGNFDIDSPFASAKRTVEERLRASGMAYTILRPSVFMEVWLSPALGFDYRQGAARIFGSGDKGISWISYTDVAKFAVESIGNPAAMDATIELGGPEPLSPLEVVQTFERASGRAFEVAHVPEEALDAQWRSAEDPLQKSFAAFMLSLSHGDPIDMSGTLQRFPVRMTSVQEYAERVARS